MSFTCPNNSLIINPTRTLITCFILSNYPNKTYNTLRVLWEQQRQLLLWIQRRQESEEEWEQLQHEIHDFVNPIMEISDTRLVSFLEIDDSFLTPWTWDPNARAHHNASLSSTRKKYMTIVPGSFFPADNWPFLSMENGTSENLRRIDDAEQVSDGSLNQNLSKTDVQEVLSNFLDTKLPKTDVEQVSEVFLNQNVPRTDVQEVPSNSLEKELLPQTDVEQVSEVFLNQNVPRTDVQEVPGNLLEKKLLPQTDVEQVSEVFLNQNVPRTDVQEVPGNLPEKKLLPKTIMEQVSEDFLNQNVPRTDVQEVPGNLLLKKLLPKTNVEQVPEDSLTRHKQRRPNRQPKKPLFSIHTWRF